MHKNNPNYSFLFEGFNLWKHVLFKYIEINKSRTSFSMTLYIINLLVFITVVESVYCAVLHDSLYKADYVSSLKG